jgi:hypothetical protein
MATKDILLMKKLALLLLVATTVHAQTTVLPERYEEKFESGVTRYGNGTVQTYSRSTRVEEPGVELRQVRIGDLVRENHLSPHPVVKQDFVYMQSRCRWFRDLIQYQIIACQVQPNVWQVIDKF